jgi:hypothetical protein
VRRDLDVTLQELALAQYGAVSRQQAKAIGLSYVGLGRRVASGPWREETDRVIVSATARDCFELRASVAVLDAGAGAVLSHPTATRVFDVPGFTDSPIHVSRPRQNAHTPPDGVIWHHSRFLPDHHILIVNGLAVTTPARMIADLASLADLPDSFPRVLHPKKVERIADSAFAMGLFRRSDLEAMEKEWCRRGRRGSVWLHEYLESRPKNWVPPASNVARRFVQLIKDAGMPEPRSEVNVGNANRWLGRVDCLDPELPLIAEIDSDRYHVAPLDSESDARRDIDMGDSGFATIRFTESEIWFDPQGTVARWRAKRDEVRRKRAS